MNERLFQWVQRRGQVKLHFLILGKNEHLTLAAQVQLHCKLKTFLEFGLKANLNPETRMLYTLQLIKRFTYGCYIYKLFSLLSCGHSTHTVLLGWPKRRMPSYHCVWKPHKMRTTPLCSYCPEKRRMVLYSEEITVSTAERTGSYQSTQFLARAICTLFIQANVTNAFT